TRTATPSATATQTATATRTNTAVPGTATGTPTATRTPTPGVPCNINVHNGNCPRAAVAFNESTVLLAVRPLGFQADATTIQAFYGDEHALTLGGGAVEPTPATAGCSQNALSDYINVGTGEQDPSGRPLAPSLFVTDITDNLDSTDGDWQCGDAAPTPIPPNVVCGTWKASNGSDPAADNCPNGPPNTGTIGAGM